MKEKKTKQPQYRKAIPKIFENCFCSVDKDMTHEEIKQSIYDWYLFALTQHNIPHSHEFVSDLKTHHVFALMKKRHIEKFEFLHGCNCFKEVPQKKEAE